MPGPKRGSSRPAQLATTLALTVAYAGLAVATFVAVYLAAYKAFVKFSPGFLATLATPFRLSKTLEFALYATSFGVLLPVGALLAARQVRALERRGEDSVPLAILNVAALAGILACARIALSGAPALREGDASRQVWVTPVAVSVSIALLVLASANVAVALGWWIPPRRLFPRDAAVPLVVAAFVAAALVFVPRAAFLPSRALPAAGGAVALYAAWRWAQRLRLPARLERFADAGVVVLVVLLSWSVYLPSGSAFVRGTAHYWNVFLGPANSVLHDRTALVDVFGQYGPGLTYFLAGLFTFLPIGYGSFALVIATLTTLLFVLMYAVFRLADTPRLLALFGVVIALTTAIFVKLGANTINPGRPLRLLWPLLAVTLVLIGERRPGRRNATMWALAVVVALSSIWATETFLYTATATLAALLCRARLDAPETAALRPDWSAVKRIIASVAAAQVAFAVGTRLVGGAWPAWQTYWEHSRTYSTGAGAQPMVTFGPGVLLGIFYFGCCAASIVLLVWNRDFATRNRVLVVALCAVEGAAVAHYSYFAGQAQVNNLYKVAPLAVMVGILWLALGERGEGRLAAIPRAALALFAFWLVGTAVIARHSQFFDHVKRTALFSNPAATINYVRRAANEPIADPRAPQAVELMQRTIGTGDRVLVLLPDTLTTEVLMRARSGQLLPISDPYQESLQPSRFAYLLDLARRLPTGTPFISDVHYFETEDLSSGELNLRLLHELKQSFVIRPEASDGSLRVYRLVGRR